MGRTLNSVSFEKADATIPIAIGIQCTKSHQSSLIKYLWETLWWDLVFPCFGGEKKNKNPALYCRASDLTRIKHLIDCLTKN